MKRVMMKKVSPQIYTYSGFDHGTVEVEIKLQEPMTLTDINIKLLEFVIGNWKKRNIKHVDDSESVNSLSRPTLLFPLSPGQRYQDTVTLCRINGGGTPLADRIDRLTEREMISGRVYSSVGSSIEKTYGG